MTQPVELVLIGAGQRGQHAYAPYALNHPNEARFVAVAEPDPVRRERFAQEHGIPPERRFAGWDELFAQGQIAAGALICTQDRLHEEPAVKAMETGYDVLLEKPMAPTLAGCVRIVHASERTGRRLQICHVMRYSNFYNQLHQILESGRLGEIITVDHRENVGYWHMAHSFVRGHWRNSGESSPMILSKCCHDLDLLYWNLGQPCLRLSSFGALRHFRSDQVGPETESPFGIPERCTDNCPIERECPFSAISIYLECLPFRDPIEPGPTPNYYELKAPPPWPMSVLTDDPSYAARLQALQTGPYGRCVYRCDNDVVDHQVIAMEFVGGTSATFAMHGHSHEDYRSMRYDGTRATLRARSGDTQAMTIHDHRSGRVEHIPLEETSDGHGGGDEGAMRAFIRALSGVEGRGEAPPLTSGRASLESHLMAFAAEAARLKGTVVNLEDFRAQAEQIAKTA